MIALCFKSTLQPFRWHIKLMTRTTLYNMTSMCTFVFKLLYYTTIKIRHWDISLITMYLTLGRSLSHYNKQVSESCYKSFTFFLLCKHILQMNSCLLFCICSGILQRFFWQHFLSGLLFFCHTGVWKSIRATFLPFELVVFSVSCPSGAEAHQLSCDVCEAPLQTSGALLPEITMSVAGVWWTWVLFHQRNNNLFSHISQQWKCRIHNEVYETNLGLSYQGGLSITQWREREAEFCLSITLTKIEREKEDT